MNEFHLTNLEHFEDEPLFKALDAFEADGAKDFMKWLDAEWADEDYMAEIDARDWKETVDDALRWARGY